MPYCEEECPGTKFAYVISSGAVVLIHVLGEMLLKDWGGGGYYDIAVFCIFLLKRRKV
jgi:hypothetical protein